MTEIRPAQILLEICDLVDSDMAARSVSLPGNGFFADELRAIQQPERREFLKHYICEFMIAQLLGVMDQTRCLALCLDTPGIAISPYVLIRGLLEYSYRIAYIADPLIDSEERTGRSLKLFVTEYRAYEKMPQGYRSDEAGRDAFSRKELAVRWYRELTGKELKRISTEAIMASVWKAGLGTLQEQGPVPNSIYEIGYRTGSVVAHGNTWAIRLFCLETRHDEGGNVLTPHLKEQVSSGMLVLAAHILQLSYGFVCQFGNTLPTSMMNRLKERIDVLIAMRAGN